MKSVTIAVLVLCCVAFTCANFNRFNLAAGETYLVNGTFQGWNNLTGAGAPTWTIWAQNATAGKYFQDLQGGGQYYYSGTASYAVRNGVCYQIVGYTSATLVSTYGSAMSYQVDDNTDNRTYAGMGASTCGTPLSHAFKVNSKGILKHWVFQQLSPISIFCLDVNGQLDFTASDVDKHFDQSILDPPASCDLPAGSYCDNFYFQPGQRCNYAFYFTAS